MQGAPFEVSVCELEAPKTSLAECEGGIRRERLKRDELPVTNYMFLGWLIALSWPINDGGGGGGGG